MTQIVPDNWNTGDAYERYVGRWSRQIAPRFLAWLGAATGQTWLDLGCGTGAVSSAIFEDCAPDTVIALDSSAGFLQAARASLPGAVRLAQGSASAIPLRDAAVDAVVSGLVLNFVSDQGAMAHEMARVTRRGGHVGGYVWDYGEKMEFMRHFWDAASALWPETAELDQGNRFAVCKPDALHALLAGAGLRNVEVSAIDLPTVFASFTDYWLPFLGGQGSAPSFLQTLDAAAQNGLRELLRERLPTRADGSIHLIARVWAFRARVEK